MTSKFAFEMAATRSGERGGEVGGRGVGPGTGLQQAASAIAQALMNSAMQITVKTRPLAGIDGGVNLALSMGSSSCRSERYELHGRN
jgi:hypothetical protein